jgi:hypothetical protein
MDRQYLQQDELDKISNKLIESQRSKRIRDRRDRGIAVLIFGSQGQDKLGK